MFAAPPAGEVMNRGTHLFTGSPVHLFNCSAEDLPMFNPAAYENSQPDGHPVLEIVEEKPGGEPGLRLFVPLRRTELTGDVTGPLAALKLTQVFGYTRAQCDRVLE